MGAPQNAGPTFISPSDQAFVFGSQPPVGLFTANSGKLYLYQAQVGSGGGNINGCGIYESTDGGTTWTDLDAANRPTSAQGAAVQDSTNNRLILGLVTDTFPQTAQATFIKPFNLGTKTWGANIASGGPNAVTVVNSVFLRPDNSIVLIYDFGASNPGGTSRLRAAVWNGSTWTSSIDVGSAILPSQANGNINVSGACCTMDSTGLIHIVYTNSAATLFFYQQLKTDNTLGTSHQFTGLNFSSTSFGNAIISGPNVLVSFASNSFTNNALLLGTPLSNPAWSVITPSSLAQPAGQVNLAGPLGTDGTNLIWMINSLDATFTYTFYQLARSTDNGQTWTILTDNTTSPYFYSFLPGGSTQAPNTDPTFGTFNPILAILGISGTATAFGLTNVRNTSKSANLGYMLNSEAIGAAPPGTPTKFEIVLFGTKRWGKGPEPECTELPEPKHVKLFC